MYLRSTIRPRFCVADHRGINTWKGSVTPFTFLYVSDYRKMHKYVGIIRIRKSSLNIFLMLFISFSGGAGWFILPVLKNSSFNKKEFNAKFYI